MIQINIERTEDPDLLRFEVKDMDLPGGEVNDELDREDLAAISRIIHEMLDDPLYKHVVSVSYTTK